MIPQTIHYCWFGKGPKSDLNKRCLESWSRHLAHYQFKEWNESNSDLDNPYCREAYRMGLWSRLSNYVRLQVLLAEGGLYLDTDVEVLRSFDPLLSQRCFLGFQHERETPDCINGAVLGSEAGQQFLERCMKLTMEIFRFCGAFQLSPIILTTVLRDMGLRDFGLQQVEEITVYPPEYFYPYPWFGKFSQDCITENTYCIHHWEGSWKNFKPVKHRYKLKRMMREMTNKIFRLQVSNTG